MQSQAPLASYLKAADPDKLHHLKKMEQHPH
jgi:hypothetical protein